MPFVVAVLVALTGIKISRASTLLPGATISLSSANEPRNATLLAATNFNFTATEFSGKLLSKVWAGDTSNPLGGLTFAYQLLNTADCDYSLGWFSLSGFASLLVDVNYNGGGDAPRKAARSNSGDTVSFGFFDRNGQETFEPGDSSAWLIIQTDSKTWGLNQLVGVGNETVAAAAFTPVVIPEPSALGILVLSSGLMLRRRTTR